MTLLAMLLISTCGILVILSGLWVAQGLWRELMKPRSRPLEHPQRHSN